MSTDFLTVRCWLDSQVTLPASSLAVSSSSSLKMGVFFIFYFFYILSLLPDRPPLQAGGPAAAEKGLRDVTEEGWSSSLLVGAEEGEKNGGEKTA